MKVFQKALLVSALSLGVSYPLLAAEGTIVKNDYQVVKSDSVESMSADIKSLQEKKQRLEHENFKLQTQILDLRRIAPKEQASPSTSLRQDVQNLQVTMKEMVAEQKKFHRDFLRLALQIRYGMVEMDKEARELFKESLADLEGSSLEEKNQ